jgi:hypothetical protein
LKGLELIAPLHVSVENANEVKGWLEDVERVDREEDDLYGDGSPFKLPPGIPPPGRTGCWGTQFGLLFIPSVFG